MKLLIAEDDLFFQTLLQQILAPDYEVMMANDGDEAWAILQRPNAPRLAILDWVMPGLNGPEVCRKVRACPALSSLYLIILTSKNSEADIVSGLRAGADDYITKPPLAAGLRARVRVGERVLELQDAVNAQALVAGHASKRGRTLRDAFAGGPASEPVLDQEPLREARETFETGNLHAMPGTKARSVIRQKSKHSLENRHLHR
jgi:two-component system, cell cycle response regulator